MDKTDLAQITFKFMATIGQSALNRDPHRRVIAPTSSWHLWMRLDDPVGQAAGVEEGGDMGRRLAGVAGRVRALRPDEAAQKIDQRIAVPLDLVEQVLSVIVHGLTPPSVLKIPQLYLPGRHQAFIDGFFRRSRAQAIADQMNIAGTTREFLFQAGHRLVPQRHDQGVNAFADYRFAAG